MTVEIPLSRGLVALVDEIDWERSVGVGVWHALESGLTHYARRIEYRAGTANRSVLLHNFITGWSMVDHRNGDGLDNRRSNLRPATHSQNMANKRRYRNNTSGFKGVTRNTGTGRPWRASLKHDGRRFHLGYFDSAAEAARAYDAAAIETFGEFARPNFPTEIPT